MFNEQIQTHSQWRQTMDRCIGELATWLQQHDLLGADIKSQLGKIRLQNKSDKLMVAFVAEFSRGKSELINAIFFASYGRRIMPASAGRTTMCPTELGYNEGDPACLRLLPIQTRLQAQPLMEWRLMPQNWTQVDLDVNDPQQLIEAINKVSETIRVPLEEARGLGFWNEDADDNPLRDAQGMVEVPRWRHALINMDHPLLRQGLVVLDTPGLNAIGAEPELTMSLIPQAQAVVFILGADTGVTASDLSMWREFLAGADDADASRFVVLNKIDTLWDELNTPQQIEDQIERQRVNSAQILGVPSERVMAVSAQKGLLAKVQGDERLLQASRLPHLEEVLGTGMVERRQEIVAARFMAELRDIQQQVLRVLDVREAEFTEQLAELDGLQGKSDAVVHHQRLRIMREQEQFDTSVGRAHAVRLVHHKILQKIYTALGSNQLLKETSLLNQALQESGFMKLGVKKAYQSTFERLQERIEDAQAQTNEMHTMFVSMFKQINTEFGFTLQVEAAPRLDASLRELREIEESHEKYLGVGNMLKLSQPEFIDRLLRALVSRLRIVFERTLNDIEHWSKGVASQIDAQLRERRRGFKRRLSMIERAEEAASGLDERIAEVRRLSQANASDRSDFEELMLRLSMSGAIAPMS